MKFPKRMVLLTPLLATFCATAQGEPRPKERPAPEEPQETISPADQAGIDAMLLKFQTDPEFAGSKVGLAWGSNYRIIDRSMEAVAAKAPKPQAKTELTQAIGEAISRSASSSIAIRFSYEKKGIDENGKPYTETITIDAGMATGAAAEAQNSMNEAMGKNHQ